MLLQRTPMKMMDSSLKLFTRELAPYITVQARKTVLYFAPQHPDHVNICGSAVVHFPVFLFHSARKIPSGFLIITSQLESAPTAITSAVATATPSRLTVVRRDPVLINLGSC